MMGFPAQIKKWAIASINQNAAIMTATSNATATHLNELELPSSYGIFVGVENPTVENRHVAQSADLRIGVYLASEAAVHAADDLIATAFLQGPSGTLNVSAANGVLAPSAHALRLNRVVLAQHIPPTQQGPQGGWIGQRIYRVTGRHTASVVG